MNAEDLNNILNNPIEKCQKSRIVFKKLAVVRHFLFGIINKIKTQYPKYPNNPNI